VTIPPVDVPIAPPRKVRLLYAPHLSGSIALAADIAARLAEWQVQTTRDSVDAEDADSHWASVDMAIALGGDGTMLRAGCLAAPHKVPVLGVNLGRLGFLAEVQPNEWPGVLARVIASDYWLERRTMLRAAVEREGVVIHTYDVLNEVVVGRGLTGRSVRIESYIDGGLFLRYVADGVIVATATGSTAYAMAAGGPILPPELKNILMVAVAPHMIIDRPVVMDEGTTVELRVAGGVGLPPALTGQTAQDIVGEFSLCLYAERQGYGPAARYLWQPQADPKVWGAGLKLPSELAKKIPPTIPQDWTVLERYLTVPTA